MSQQNSTSRSLAEQMKALEHLQERYVYEDPGNPIDGQLRFKSSYVLDLIQ